MYSSPGTPTGTGSPPASSTYTCVFAIGRPIGGPAVAPLRQRGSGRHTVRLRRPVQVDQPPRRALGALHRIQQRLAARQDSDPQAVAATRRLQQPLPAERGRRDGDRDRALPQPSPVSPGRSSVPVSAITCSSPPAVSGGQQLRRPTASKPERRDSRSTLARAPARPRRCRSSQSCTAPRCVDHHALGLRRWIPRCRSRRPGGRGPLPRLQVRSSVCSLDLPRHSLRPGR